MEDKLESFLDEQLIRKISDRDQKAFAELVRRYLRGLVKFSARYTQNIPCSEDIVQETFLRVWQQAGSWSETKGSAKSWLFKIAYNATMDYLRKQKRHRAHQEEIESETPIENSPEKRLLDIERKEQVDQAFFDLPEQQRTALTLFLMNGLSGREVAVVLGLTKEATDSLLARARGNLKKKMREEPITKRAANS